MTEIPKWDLRQDVKPKTFVLPPFTGEVFEQTFRDAVIHPLVQHVHTQSVRANVDRLMFTRINLLWDEYTIRVRVPCRLPDMNNKGMLSLADVRPVLFFKLDVPRNQWLDYAIRDAENCICELTVSTGILFPANSCAFNLKAGEVRPIATTTWTPYAGKSVSHPIGPLRGATSTFSLEELDAPD